MSEADILIVEDDRGVRLILTDFLTDAGFPVRTASDGVEGLERCREALPALMITDLNMPRLGGAELVAALEAEGSGSFPVMSPVIVVSGQHDVVAHPPTFAAYAEPKPMDLDRLEAWVRRLMPAPEVEPAESSEPAGERRLTGGA